MLEGLERIDRYSIYVTSFSQKSDDLNQWRAYGRGVEPAICIGFDAQILDNLDSPEVLIPCLYGKQEHIDQVALAIKTVSERALEENLAYPSIASLFVGELLRVIPACKNFSFKEEEEWRLAIPEFMLLEPDFIVDYQVRGSLLRPYVSIPLTSQEFPGINPIRSVTIGPGPHQDLSAAAVIRCLHRYNLDHSNVNCSETPFRGW